MSATPVTSIVIPAFNAEEYLERTLCSALAQTLRDIEVIVIDDGSTDGTEWIAKKIASEDSRVKVISVANGGVARARNLGIENAKGQFIAFLDADDLWHPSKLENQVSALTVGEGTSAAAAYTRMRIIDWEDRVIRNGGGVVRSGRTLAHHMFARPVGNGSSMMVRREVAHEVGGFDPSQLDRGIGGCEDLDFELKIAARYPMIGIRRYLVGYRSHPANMSSDSLTLARSVLSTMEYHLKLHPELPSWAVRKIRASTIESALQNIAGMSRWNLFVAELLRLQTIDIRRGLLYGARFLGRKIVRPILRAETSDATSVRPFFYELNPDLDEALPGRPPRASDLRVMRRLAEVDAKETQKVQTQPAGFAH